jgi:hypothetical protein
MLAGTGRRNHLTFGNSLSRMKREVGVSFTPRGLRQIARSISRLSPIVRRPVVLLPIKIASLILRPDRRLVDVTSFHSVRRPSFKFGSSSFISRRRHCLSVSFRRLRPPGNIQSLSRRRLTRRTRPFFEATNFDDFAISENAPRRFHGERRFFRPSIKETPPRKLPMGLSQFTDNGGLPLHPSVCPL